MISIHINNTNLLIFERLFGINNNMRLNKQQIEHMSFSIVNGLLKEEVLITDDRERLMQEIEHLIAQELQREDDLDARVKEILKEKFNEIRSANIDYFEMYKMIKSRLADEENIVL